MAWLNLRLEIAGMFRALAPTPWMLLSDTSAGHALVARRLERLREQWRDASLRYQRRVRADPAVRASQSRAVTDYRKRRRAEDPEYREHLRARQRTYDAARRARLRARAAQDGE